MSDIVSGLAALKTAFDIAKELKNATSAYNDAEMRLRFSELYSALTEAKIELADAQLEMHKLKQKVTELQSKLDATDDIVFRDGLYWRAAPIEGKPNGPFCPSCYEGPQKRTVSMTEMPPEFHFGGRYHCNTCDAYVG